MPSIPTAEHDAPTELTDTALAVDPELTALRHGLDPLPALASRSLALPGHPLVRVELRALERGHQVVVHHDDQVWTETVAHLPGEAGGLPTAHSLAAPLDGGGDYEVRCVVTAHSPRGMALQRDRSRQQASTAAAQVRLRGRDGASAGLCVFTPDGDDDLVWRSWRTCPDRGLLLQTVSTLRLPACQAAAPQARAS